MVHTCCDDGSGAHFEIGHPGLHGDLMILEVDIENRSHPAQADDDAVGDWERTPGQPRAGAARDEWHMRLEARAHHLGHLVGAERQYHRRG
jgi:hypothetical protein